VTHSNYLAMHPAWHAYTEPSNQSQGVR